jgi:hypothetical protein
MPRMVFLVLAFALPPLIHGGRFRFDPWLRLPKLAACRSSVCVRAWPLTGRALLIRACHPPPQSRWGRQMDDPQSSAEETFAIQAEVDKIVAAAKARGLN